MGRLLLTKAACFGHKALLENSWLAQPHWLPRPGTWKSAPPPPPPEICNLGKRRPSCPEIRNSDPSPIHGLRSGLLPAYPFRGVDGTLPRLFSVHRLDVQQ